MSPFGCAHAEILRSLLTIVLRAISGESEALFSVEMHLDQVELEMRCSASDVEKELETLLKLIHRISNPAVLAKAVPHARAALAEEHNGDWNSVLPQIRQALFPDHHYGVWAYHGLNLTESIYDEAIVEGLVLLLKQAPISCIAIVPDSGAKSLTEFAKRVPSLIGRALECGGLSPPPKFTSLPDLPQAGLLNKSGFALGVRTFGIADPHAPMHAILAACVHSRSGRLHALLRDQLALVYSISARVRQGLYGGLVGVYVRTQTSSQDTVLELAIHEIRCLLVDGMTQVELDRCKRIALLGLGESLSSPHTLIRRIGMSYHLDRVWDVEAELREIDFFSLPQLHTGLIELGRYPVITLTADVNGAMGAI